MASEVKTDRQYFTLQGEPLPLMLSHPPSSLIPHSSYHHRTISTSPHCPSYHIFILHSSQPPYLLIPTSYSPQLPSLMPSTSRHHHHSLVPHTMSQTHSSTTLLKFRLTITNSSSLHHHYALTTASLTTPHAPNPHFLSQYPVKHQPWRIANIFFDQSHAKDLHAIPIYSKLSIHDVFV